MRGAGARAGAEVVEENFKAPSAVKKKPIPPPSTFFLLFFFNKAWGGSGFLGPRPHPGTRSSQFLQVLQNSASSAGITGETRDAIPRWGPLPAPGSPSPPSAGSGSGGRRGVGSSNWAFISNRGGGEVMGADGVLRQSKNNNKGGKKGK